MLKNYFYYEKLSTEQEIDALIDRVCDIADENRAVFIGGGFGRLCMPSDEYGDYDIPEEISSLVVDIAKNPEAHTKLRGYFIDFHNESLDADKQDFIVSESKQRHTACAYTALALRRRNTFLGASEDS